MTATTIRVQMAQRKDTAAGWTAANPILLSGEIGYETDTKKFKIGDGTTNWNSLAYLPIPDGSGNLTITGNLEIGSTGSLTFEGSTADGFETTLAVTDPTADRTITLPDASGTVITSGDTGSVTSTMLADGTIVNADINAAAEIAVSKLANGTANQVLVTDGTDVSWSDNLTLAGDLTVNGTTTTINTQDLLVEDKNIIIGNVETPTDVTADGGGITLKGSTDKTINWVDATDAWTLSENVNIAGGKEYRIDGTKVLDATSLGSAVVSSSLTSVGTIGTGTWQGTAIDAAYLDSTIVTTGDTGTVTSTMIADGTIVDGDVNASAAIAGTKISPDFGSQNVTTTGTATAAALIPSGSSVPTNGVYLPSANNVAISTNGTGRLFVDSSGRVGIGAAPDYALDVSGTITTRNSDSAAFDALQFYATGMAANNKFWRAQITTTDQNWQTVDDAYTVANTWLSATRNGNQVETIKFYTGTSGTSERLRITSDGKLGLGTSSPGYTLDVNGVARSTGTSAMFALSDRSTGTGDRYGIYSNSNTFRIYDFTAAADRLSVDSSGRVGIGNNTSGFASNLIIGSGSGNNGATIYAGTASSSYLHFADGTSGSDKFRGYIDYNHSNNSFSFATNDSTAVTIDSSQRLLVGTSTARSNVNSTAPNFQIETATTVSTAAASLSVINNQGLGASSPAINLGLTRGTSLGGTTKVESTDELGFINFVGSDGTNFVPAARIFCTVDATTGTNDMPGRLVFSTTADGASSPTERMRITSVGDLLIGKDSNASAVQGTVLSGAGQQVLTPSAVYGLLVNRLADDGDLIVFRQDNTTEGSISVSGTTVSYNGAHLSRWSQLPGGVERTEILRGTVLSNIDEMCDWGDEDNEQLNRMKVSDVEGDPNVSGVFQAWDDDDDTYTDDFYCAMTGDFIIRIAEGVTVQRGDLLMSAGDGTAKPQDDDIIRSKTIAKVTSTHVTCTYDDGSYCVPCVMMAC